jgi:hypothetical protein
MKINEPGTKIASTRILHVKTIGRRQVVTDRRYFSPGDSNVDNRIEALPGIYDMAAFEQQIKSHAILPASRLRLIVDGAYRTSTVPSRTEWSVRI